LGSSQLRVRKAFCTLDGPRRGWGSSFDVQQSFLLISKLYSQQLIESLLVEKARAKKTLLREMFIEYGYPMNDLEDIKANLELLRDDEWKSYDVCGNEA